MRELPPVCNLETSLGQSSTKRSISPGAEEVLGERYRVLDHGFVALVDYMGNDDAVVQAARVSYGKGTKTVSEDRGLIRYLMRHQHTTPLEMVEFKWHVAMPIFVARQWIRHRTANVNEVSFRYSKPRDKFYIPKPDAINVQSPVNKQGRGERVSPEQAQRVIELIRGQGERGMESYEEMTRNDVARELARIGLPVNLYTEWYWKNDLHNTLRFLSLRLHPHAQKEIRDYAGAMAAIVQRATPLTWEAFEDYQLHAKTLSRPEQEVVRLILQGNSPDEAAKILPTRERGEFLDKWKDIRESDLSA